MPNAFVERCHSKTSSFHLPHGEMSITLDDVSHLLHLPIGERFLDNGRITKDEAIEIVVEYLGADPEKAMNEVDRSRGAHARFEFLRNIYETEIQRAEQDDGDAEQVMVHKSHALRAYLLFFVGTLIFMDKSATYTDIVYL
ncbi:protein MAIN-LIKE 1-like [Lathyrus oleraceus]|uniref:protein MAIN-LIKE 1-like n=1 Tax=Pisum sativum TaxID=3888 RepID=UPI0021D2D319|nr:protein MAIN-LIKE 1-like [Pisum sativum]